MVQIAGCAEHWDRVGVVASEQWREAVDAISLATSVLARGSEPLVWMDEACSLAVGDDAHTSRLGIRIRAFTWVFLDEHGQLQKTLPLSGQSGQEASAWLSRRGVEVGALKDFPASPGAEALVNLDRSISNVHEAIGHIARVTHGSSHVHTDAATLETSATIALASREGEPTRQIVVGFSTAGDQGEIFVRAGPTDESTLSLTMRDVARLSDVDAQAGAIELFLRESLEQAYASHSREWRSRRPSAY